MVNVSSEAVGVGAGVLIRALAALDIDRHLDGIDLCRTGPLRLARDAHAAPEIGVSRRIGLSRETDRLLRFYVRGNPFVSGPKKLNR
jgi:DNA-3-methyladenine glycosylase